MSTSKVEALRARVRASALEQFAQRGFDGTSVQRVADAAGVSKQLLLYHFRNKDALKLAVVTEIIERWQHLIPQLMDSAAGHENAFEALMTEVIEEIASAPHTSQFILRELMTPGSEVAEMFTEAFEPILSAMPELGGRTQFEASGLLLLTVSAIYPVNEDVRTRQLEHIHQMFMQAMGS